MTLDALIEYYYREMAALRTGNMDYMTPQDRLRWLAYRDTVEWLEKVRDCEAIE